MNARQYSVYNPENGLACGIIAVVLGLIPLVGGLIALARKQYAVASFGLIGGAVGLAGSFLLWRIALSDTICLSETGLQSKGWLSQRVEIRWEDMQSVVPRRQRGSLWRRSIVETTWIVRAHTGQKICIPSSAATEDILRSLRRILPEQAWEQTET